MKYVPLSVFVLGLMASELYASSSRIRQRREAFRQCATAAAAAPEVTATAPGDTATPTAAEALPASCPRNPTELERELFRNYRQNQVTDMAEEAAKITELGLSTPPTQAQLQGERVRLAFLNLRSASRDREQQMFHTLCSNTTGNGNAMVCLDDQDREEMRDRHESSRCLVERRFQIYNSPGADPTRADALWARVSDRHDREWRVPVARGAVRECNSLLATDRDSIDHGRSGGRYTNCSWDEGEQRARKILSYPGQGCGSNGRRQLCSGYVTCDAPNGGVRFSRLSVCSVQNCGPTPGAATACTNEQGFSSNVPEGISAPPIPVVPGEESRGVAQ
jgi:hypothetical protein